MNRAAFPPPPRPCVLIVDRSADAREVLRTLLEPQGVQVLEACEARQGLELARRRRPDVVVLDLETESADEEGMDAALARASAGSLVVLGRAPRQARQAGGHALAKPYHYGPLLRTIEQLIQSREAAATRRAA